MRYFRVLALVAAVAGLVTSPWMVDESGAQEHPHPTTTTTEQQNPPTTPPPTTPPPTTPPTTQPPPTGPRPPGEQTKNVRYTTYTIQPAPPTPDGKHGHAHTGNLMAFGVEKPCSDCYITGMKANLVDASGASVGIHDEVMLHHMVLFNAWDGREDATCAFPLGFLGQRFFASGDERTPIVAQPGYGYYVGPNGGWNLIYELMSMSRVPETVSVEVEFMYIPAAQAGNITRLEPVWFDIDQCGDSEVSLPAGRSSRSWSWTVNRPGRIIGIGGHLHSGGINIDIRNDSTGQQICNSVAGYGETPMYVDHHGEAWLSSMSTCGGARQPAFAVPISSGQRITITGNYDMPAAVDDQMAIVIAYVARECTWWEIIFGLCR